MGITGFPGNLVVFGQAPSNDYNTDDAPSMFKFGGMILDPRSFYTYNPGQDATVRTYGWVGLGYSPVIDQVPTAVSSNGVAQNQALTAATAVTLTASNTANVTINQTITNAVTGASVTGIRAIDGVQAPITYGSDANVAAWSPATAISRNITITTTGNDLGGFWNIAGYDLYGYPVSESVSASSSAATLTSRKTYKYIASITPVTSGTFGSSSVMVGVGDVFGLPLYVPRGEYIRGIFGSLESLSSQITAGATATATSTTADVRGTFSSTLTSSAGTNRLVVFWSPNVAVTGTSEGLVGVTQYST